VAIGSASNTMTNQKWRETQVANTRTKLDIRIVFVDGSGNPSLEHRLCDQRLVPVTDGAETDSFRPRAACHNLF
jgi:hypothetical protein